MEDHMVPRGDEPLVYVAWITIITFPVAFFLALVLTVIKRIRLRRNKRRHDIILLYLKKLERSLGKPHCSACFCTRVGRYCSHCGWTMQARVVHAPFYAR